MQVLWGRSKNSFEILSSRGKLERAEASVLVFRGHLSTNFHTWWKLNQFIPRLAMGKCFSSPAALPPLADIYWEKNIRYSKCRPDVKSGRRAKISICRMPFSSYGGCVEEVAMSHGNLNRLRKPHPLSYAFLLGICRTGVFSLSSQ